MALSDKPEPGTPVVAWEVRLGEEQPNKRLIALAAAILASFVGWALYQNVMLSVLAFLLIIGSSLELWVPIRYRLDETGASSTLGFSKTSMEWSNVRRVILGRRSVRLSPLRKASRLDAFRGVLLRYAGNEDLILATIRTYLGNDGRVLEERADG